MPLVQIQVPASIPADRNILVGLPSGQQVMVQVPPNVAPGATLQVQLPDAPGVPQGMPPAVPQGMPPAAQGMPIGMPVGVPIPGAGGLYPTPGPTFQPPPPPPPAMHQMHQVKAHSLKELGWPDGLSHMVANSIPSMPLRFVIVDNSGSMQSMDGSRLVPGPGGRLQSIRSTRFQELAQTINELAAVAYGVRGPTHFHFLNPCQYGQFFGVACEFAPPDGIVTAIGTPEGDLMKLQQATTTSPGGTTPLTEALVRVDSMIRPHAHTLRAQGQKVAVIITSDGLPNDPNSFLHALKMMQHDLPVWIVVRLCTSEDSVVDYWSGLDHHLETPLDILDDLESEAKEVHKKNPWLTYGPALHAARVFGLQDRLFDLLDERPLLPSQVKEFIEKLLSCGALPEPEVDPKGFKQALEQRLKVHVQVYNAVSKTMAPWVHTNRIGKGGGDCTIS